MKILKIIISVFCAFTFVYFTRHVVNSRSNQKDDSILVVGTSYDYPPYTFSQSDGNIVGFDIDLIREVAKRMGKSVKIVGMPFGALIFGLLAGDIDVIASAMSPTSRRRKAVLFSNNYLSGDQLVIVSNNPLAVPNDIKDLIGKKIAVNTGFVADSYISKQPEILSKDIVRLTTPAQSLMALQYGSVDAWVCAQSSALALIEKVPNNNPYQIASLAGTGDDYAFVASNYNSELVIGVNNALKGIICDGTLSNLKNKWKLS